MVQINCAAALVVTLVLLVVPGKAQRYYETLNGHTYVLVTNENLNWFEARDRAREIAQEEFVDSRGYLVKIDSAEEQALIDSMQLDNGLDDFDCWIGGYQPDAVDNDKANYEEYVWDTGGSIPAPDSGGVEFFLRKRGNPRASEEGESCLRTFPGEVPNTDREEGVWSDKNCYASFTNRGFVVEVDGLIQAPNIVVRGCNTCVPDIFDPNNPGSTLIEPAIRDCGSQRKCLNQVLDPLESAGSISDLQRFQIEACFDSATGLSRCDLIEDYRSRLCSDQPDPSSFNICITLDLETAEELDTGRSGRHRYTILEELETFLEQTENAKKYWEGVITDDIPDVSSARTHRSESDYIDDLMIHLTFDDLAAAEQGLTQNPCETCRRDTSLLPFYVAVSLNKRLYTNVFNRVVFGDFDLYKTLVHEFGHALGIGWTQGMFGQLTTNRDFTGVHAVAEWQRISGCNGSPPVTRDGKHWSERCMNREAMTSNLEPFLNLKEPVSAITLGALIDLGYQVDMSKADDYDECFLSKRCRCKDTFCAKDPNEP